MSDGLDLDIDGVAVHLSWTWMRDHARDAASFLDSTQQRVVTASTVATAGPGRATLTDDRLEVSWPDGPTTSFDAAFLAGIGDQQSTTNVGNDAVAWDGAALADRLTRIAFAELTGTSGGLRIALDHLWSTGIIVIEDVPTDRDSTRRVLERFGYVRRTVFGDLWEFSSDGGFDDTASTPLEITPHTDGTYSHDAPGLLGLHCHVYEATGGENVFVDGMTVAAHLSDTSRRRLAEVEIPAQYIGDGAHLMARRPALRYEEDRLVQVSYNHHDRAPFVLPEPTMSELYAALHEFDAIAHRPDLQFELPLRPGDMVIFDNWRLLHGRRAFHGERLIAGGYINREDLESTTRVAARS